MAAGALDDLEIVPFRVRVRVGDLYFTGESSDHSVRAANEQANGQMQ